MKRAYEMPEIVELGPAAALTQGGPGCKTDCDCCEQNTPANPF